MIERSPLVWFNPADGYTVHKRMKRYIPLLLDTCALVALALWLGGLAVCWTVLAPTTRSIPSDGLAAAHDVLNRTVYRFSAIVELCGLVLVALQWVLRRRFQRSKSLFVVDGARTLVVFIALFCGEYGRYVIIPTLIKSDSAGAYTTLAILALVQAILLIGYMAVTGWLHSPGQAVSTQPARQAATGSAAPAKPHERGQKYR